MKFLISMADVEDEWDTLPEFERARVAACHEAFQKAWAIADSAAGERARAPKRGRFACAPTAPSTSRPDR